MLVVVMGAGVRQGCMDVLAGGGGVGVAAVVRSSCSRSLHIGFCTRQAPEW